MWLHNFEILEFYQANLFFIYSFGSHHVVSLLPQNSLSFINSIICIPVIHIIFILLPNETMFLNYFIDLGQ